MARLLACPPILIAVSCAVLASAPARSQTREQIRQQDEQLYQQQQLQQQAPPTAPPIGGAETVPPGEAGGNLTSQLLDRVIRLEDEVRTLRGRVDELQNELQTQTAQLGKQIGDMNFALQQGHGGAAPPPPSAAAPPAAGAPPASVHRTPESALRQATVALAHHDYAGAADLAHQAIASGGGVHAAQAQYVLGEALAGQGNHGGAAAAYYAAYQKEPHGPFAGEALVHVSASLIATGDTKAACEALAELRASVPNARAGVLRQASALRGRAHCT